MKRNVDTRDREQERGVRCPKCHCGHVPVLYTRKVANGGIRRRRECRACGRRFTTYERPA